MPNQQNPNSAYDRMRSSQSSIEGPSAGNPAVKTSRIPNDQIPNPLEVRESDQQNFNSIGTYRTSVDMNPPMITTSVEIVDDGNCNPEFIKSTVSKIPSTKDLCDGSGIPLGVIVQPFAESFSCPSVFHSPAGMSRDLPVVDCTSGSGSAAVNYQAVAACSGGIQRCKNCMAYINPFVIFSSGGRRYKCNICEDDNDVGQDYVCSMDAYGQRADLAFRPELKYGSVEFIVENEYINRPSAQCPPMLWFLIDVSNADVISLFVESIKRCSTYLKEQTIFEKIAIAAFDKDIHFFDFTDPSGPSMHTITDLTDAYSPLTQDCASITAGSNLDNALNLLDTFCSLFQSSHRTDNALGPALKYVLECMQGRNGKIVVLNSGFFGCGPESLLLRDESSSSNVEKDKQNLLPQGNYLSDIAIKASTNGVSIDMFVHTGAFVDIASISVLSSLSGGDLYYYSSNNSLDSNRVADDLLACISSVRAFDVFSKIRVSDGLSVTDYFGNIYMRTTNEMSLGSVSKNKSFAVALAHDGKIADRSKVSIQFAILFTDCKGVRKVRVHNFSMSVCTSATELFSRADSEAISLFLTKKAVSLVAFESISVIRDLISQRIAAILLGYRKLCTPQAPDTQLVLPESLKLLPIFLLAVQKTKSFSVLPVKNDLRLYWLRLLNNIDLRSFSYLAYPKLYRCSMLNWSQIENGVLPPPISLSYEFLCVNEVYCAYNGTTIFIWIGKETNAEMLNEYFGVSSLAALVPNAMAANFPVTNSEGSKSLRYLIKHLQDSHACIRSPAIVVVRQGIDPSEVDFAASMVNDQSSGLPSYIDYLCQLHSIVKANLKK